MRILKESLNAETIVPEQETVYISFLVVQVGVEKFTAQVISHYEMSKDYLRHTLRKQILGQIEAQLFGERR